MNADRVQVGGDGSALANRDSVVRFLFVEQMLVLFVLGSPSAGVAQSTPRLHTLPQDLQVAVL